jgi:hypothetical protein
VPYFPNLGNGASGGAAGADVADTVLLTEDDNEVALSIDNTGNAHPIAVELSLSGTDAAKFALSASLVAVAALDTGSVNVERAPGETDAYSDAQLDIIHSSGEAQAVAVSCDELVDWSTSYVNTLSSGDRTLLIVATHGGFTPTAGDMDDLIDGSTTGVFKFPGGQDATGDYLRFDMGAPKVMDECTFTQTGAAGHGTWKWQGSDDEAIWDDIGSSFTFGAATTQVQTQLNGNVTPYRYYQLVGISGVTHGGPALKEMTFKISA